MIIFVTTLNVKQKRQNDGNEKECNEGRTAQTDIGVISRNAKGGMPIYRISHLEAPKRDFGEGIGFNAIGRSKPA